MDAKNLVLPLNYTDMRVIQATLSNAFFRGGAFEVGKASFGVEPKEGKPNFKEMKKTSVNRHHAI